MVRCPSRWWPTNTKTQIEPSSFVQPMVASVPQRGGCWGLDDHRAVVGPRAPAFGTRLGGEEPGIGNSNTSGWPVWPTTGGCRSGSALVLVDDAAEDVAAVDLAAGVRDHRPGHRLGEPKAAVWPGLVVAP